MHERRLLVWLVLLLVPALLLHLASGPNGPAPLLSLFDKDHDRLARLILVEIRLPRALLALLVGGALGSAGAALQGFLRNPLAEPGVIGVSASASLGAVAVLYFGAMGSPGLSLPFAAMGGALATTALLVALVRAGAGTLVLILAGVGINALAAAATALLLDLSPNPFALADMVSWLMGSFENRSLADVRLAAPFVIVGLGLLLATGRGLSALTLGEETARSLGVRVERLGIMVIMGAGIAVGGAVAVSGAIGFVGLVVPHILRPFVDHAPERLLRPSALGGALLLLVADALTRIMPTAQPLNIGVVTAFVGAPVFLNLIWRANRWRAA
ncbi:MAG: iron ABC transporter permease [Alphaproteobacteria bacterium]|nr:MAG: iron ABC transporter permease [Alphaproteobacteria bacterium]